MVLTVRKVQTPIHPESDLAGLARQHIAPPLSRMHNTPLGAQETKKITLKVLKHLTAKNHGSTDGSRRSSPVGKPFSLPLELSSLHWLSEHICMHKLGAQVLDDNVSVCHPFCHPKMTDVDVTGPLRSRPTALHERHAAQVVLVDNHWPNGVTLLRHKVFEVDGLSCGVGEANQFCLGAGLSHNLLL